MDDRFLSELRREPHPGFARSLRERLRSVEDDMPVRRFQLLPALATAAGVALIVLLFTAPAVRVAAQNALDLFRVRSFTAVEIDDSRMDQLRAMKDQLGDDPAAVVFGKPEVLQEPAKPVEYPSADLAGNAAGLPGLLQPRQLPDGMHFTKAIVTGEGAARLTVHADNLRKVIELLGLTDVRVPDQLDGKQVTVHMPQVVHQQYENGKTTLTLIEAHSPEVSMPTGVDLKQLGEIGLRILGLDANEAGRVAASVDWRSTLIVPVPTTAASFSQVDVNGHRGLLIRCEAPDENGR